MPMVWDSKTGRYSDIKTRKKYLNRIVLSLVTGAMMLDSGMLGGGLEAADKVFSWCLFDEPVLLEVWNTIPEHPLQAEETDGDRHWIDDSPTLQVGGNF